MSSSMSVDRGNMLIGWRREDKGGGAAFAALASSSESCQLWCGFQKIVSLEQLHKMPGRVTMCHGDREALQAVLCGGDSGSALCDWL